MRKIAFTIFSALLLSFSSLTSSAQRVEISPYIGYMFYGNISYYPYYDVNFDDNMSWGGTLGYRASNRTTFELGYTGSFTEASIGYYDLFLPFYDNIDLSNNIISLNFKYHGAFRNAKVDPYAGFGLGYLWTNIDGSDFNYNYGTVDKFDFTLFLGALLNANDRVGFSPWFKLHIPMYFGGAGVYCGTGAGCGVSTYTVADNVHLEAGLSVVLKGRDQSAVGLNDAYSPY